MGEGCSLDRGERIGGDVEEGGSAGAAGGVFGGSHRTAVRLAAAERDHGSVAPKPKGRAPGTAGKLTAHIAFLLARMKSEPDTTLQELADVLREDRAKPDPWDETSVKTSLTRLRGRAPVGERLYGTAPFGKWRTQTRDQVRGRLFIAGLTSDELIAPWGIGGSMSAQGCVVS